MALEVLVSHYSQFFSSGFGGLGLFSGFGVAFEGLGSLEALVSRASFKNVLEASLEFPRACF